MIHIYINGKELVLKKSTTVCIELNNALLSGEDIDGDISYSFTMPARGNEEALGFPTIDAADFSAEFDCEMSIDGAFSLSGRLVVQKTSFDELTAAIIITPYPNGFADSSLISNISDTIDVFNYGKTAKTLPGNPVASIMEFRLGSSSMHKTCYKSFLESTTEDDSDIKFAAFFNDTGYGDDNESFGRWNGRAHCKIVNRIFFDTEGKIVESKDTPYFTRIFNKIFHLTEDDNSYTELNQMCLCPQIRLARILDIWCNNAGYRFINHLGDDLNNIFLQSTKALDATIAQYQDGMFNRRLTLTRFTIFSLPEAGWYELDLRETMDTIPAMVDFYFVAIESSDAINILPSEVFNGNGDDIVALLKSSLIRQRPYQKIYVPKDYAGRDLRMTVGVHFNTGAWDYANSSSNPFPVTIKQISRDDIQGGLNIFRRRFSISELMPDVSNSEFLKANLEALGLCYFVSRTSKMIEFVPFSHIKDCKSIDLSEYVLTRETETENPEDKKLIFRLTPLTDESFVEGKRLGDVENAQPDPYENTEDYVLVECTNTLYRSNTLEESDAPNGWIQKWEEHSGNPDGLESGRGTEEKHEPSVKIPHQRIVTGAVEENNQYVSMQYPVASFTISSDMYNAKEDNEDIILMQYRGFKDWKIAYRGSWEHFKQECMLPVFGNEFALRSKKGRYYAKNRTLGEDYAMPVLELANHKVLRYKLRLPKSKMMELDNLIRPSELPPIMQTRFIIINNVKTIPKRITMQIENDDNPDILCEIEAVRVY